MGVLFIAEKPDMARKISECLKTPHTRKDGYIETGEGIVTWAYGHILRLAEPDEYDKKYKDWRLEDLPIIPSQWKLIVSDSCTKQFEIIHNLIKKADEIVNAGDVGREGQLLIDEILDYVKNDKPVKRLLLNSLDEKTIKKALANLRNNQEFRTLTESALARQRADWLIGMNLSRAYTLAARKAGHSGIFSIGRVKTPTLSLIVRRELEIKNFKPITYYTINGNFSHSNGTIEAKWKPKDDQLGLDNKGRLVDKSVVDTLLNKFKAARITLANIKNVKKKEETEKNCLAFSLSSLQIEADEKFGYDPQTVLDTAQSLYEKKLTSYPRSDCNFLPENQLDDATAILNNLREINQNDIANWAASADESIKSRVWNDKKITEHHAIIPTGQACNFDKLDDKEKDIYFLIAQNYISQFYPVHIFEQTKITLSYADETFVATGKVIIKDGWKSVCRTKNDSEYKETSEDDESDEDGEEGDANLPKVISGDNAEYIVAPVKEKATAPPKRFTPGTLVKAMKNIYFYVKNPDLKKQLRDVSGIGTEATRAGIIKELMDKGFLSEQKKYLYPTEPAYLLVSILPDELTYPDSTALWEEAFNKIVQGGVNLDKFIDYQISFVTQLCRKASTITIKEAPGVKCPVCQKGILRKMRKKSDPDSVFWGCSKHPDCRTIFADNNGKPQIVECPICKKGFLRKIKNDKGFFWGCGRHPECNALFDDKNGQPVPKRKAAKK